ncbi:carbamoyltransferase C-terminal domain-containing protein [Xenorhabdus khoisanae]|uniref:carbamoyltransferase family protein n=1 Tax=Xenorhabdus khoisanae TaxID=880157 RepID=UPI002359F6E3|nr:carbamoyltransferase C-terminal domain-containing protein [Xenorhabdus khoisanae]MDC9613632.1 carbamoyltransferase C-terminal domain-containing protein [Xenorhabdus khoisanae]
MKILGYNGLNGAVRYRREAFDDLTDNEYAMCQGMDSSVCLIVDGRIVAAVAEERFTGEKFTSDFPRHAIQYCLEEAGISANDLDVIAHSFDYQSYQNLFKLGDQNGRYYDRVLAPENQAVLWRTHFSLDNIDTLYTPCNHHLAHAAMAFYPSGFERSLVVVADGLGEMTAISVYEGHGNDLKLLNQQGTLSSLGILYSQITAHLGFGVNSDEYKIMGLASYGNPEAFRHIFEEIVELSDGGKVIVRAFERNINELERQTGRGFRRWLDEHVIKERGTADVVTQTYRDFAAALQKRLEDALFHVISHWKAQTDADHLCFAGGVALNCTANGKLLRSGLFKHVFIPPAADDGGTAIGAAMLCHVEKSEEKKIHFRANDLPYWGHEIHEDEIKASINDFGSKITFRKLDDAALLEAAADDIKEDKIIAWVQGRMEFGQRALGNRSILANPGSPLMKERVNARIKKREEFRPFAPSVKYECAHTYFELTDNFESPHMLYTIPVRKEWVASLPAITHVDGTARVQTVNREKSGKYWELLDEVQRRTSMPVVLNTSFNIKGQPIVRTAKDAIETLFTANLDALYIGNYVIKRKEGLD